MRILSQNDTGVPREIKKKEREVGYTVIFDTRLNFTSLRISRSENDDTLTHDLLSFLIFLVLKIAKY